MKKSIIIWIVSVLCAVVLIWLLFNYYNSPHKLYVNRVKEIKIVSFTTLPTVTLNAEETVKFIELFNSASYEGKTTGEGGTPDWTVFVFYQDGSNLNISEFGSAGSKCEVEMHNKNLFEKSGYYVSSAELRAFILEMQNKK